MSLKTAFNVRSFQDGEIVEFTVKGTVVAYDCDFVGVSELTLGGAADGRLRDVTIEFKEPEFVTGEYYVSSTGVALLRVDEGWKVAGSLDPVDDSWPSRPIRLMEEAFGPQ
jgi:hypothetical protein